MRLCHVLTLALSALGLLVGVDADIYLHNKRGSNNRLDEANRDRVNANRLFDSQNNNRGGYNVGTMFFYEGSQLPLSWTNQHSCGDSRAMCEIVIQYMCDDLLRDGTVTDTIPFNDQLCYGHCDTDVRFGRHESQQYYNACRLRARNRGLYLGSQSIQQQNNGATYTRQNPQGTRYGYECPEERDYYPYWGPSPWRDIAILTNQPSRCAQYRAESQNVKPRYYCYLPPALINTLPQMQRSDAPGVLPIDQTSCEAVQGSVKDPTTNITSTYRGMWKQDPAFGIPPPDCLQTSWTRDNHLGNTFGGFPPGYNWTIPALSTLGGVNAERCALRIRYNITTGDFSAGDINSGDGVFASATSPLVGTVDSKGNKQVNDQTQNRFPATIDIWSKYGLTNLNDSSGRSVFDSFRSWTNNPLDPIARRNTREYVMKNNPNVDFFGTLIPHNTVNQTIKLQLAINTAQYGRTFQDRSFRFAIRPPPAGVSGNTIYNLNVQGKRGNIVQVFPGVEYDFAPNRLEVPVGSNIHIQWTGSNTNPNNNAGQGVAGSDRSNIMLLRPKVYNEYGQGTTNPTTYGHWGVVYPNRIDNNNIGGSSELHFLGLTDKTILQQLAILDTPGGQWGGSMAELNDAGTYFNAGLIPASVAGIYHYLCTRNNNFSNRDQKGKIVVSSSIPVRAPVTNSLTVPVASPNTPAIVGGILAALGLAIAVTLLTCWYRTTYRSVHTHKRVSSAVI